MVPVLQGTPVQLKVDRIDFRAGLGLWQEALLTRLSLSSHTCLNSVHPQNSTGREKGVALVRPLDWRGNNAPTVHGMFWKGILEDSKQGSVRVP